MNGENVIVLRGYKSSEASPQMQQIAAELWLAIQSTESMALTRIAASLPTEFFGALGRRAKNVGIGLRGVVGFASNEVSAISESAANGTLAVYLKSRRGDAATSVTAACEQIAILGRDLHENPREQLPRMLLIVGAALLSSGGLDGDGGIPDLDIPLLGIGAHRSPLTHSFLTGAVLEALAIALVRCICVVYENLPPKRHPGWDKVTPTLIQNIETARGGAALGLAYHFLVDGLLQPAPYHGLPIEMPLEAHQAIFVTSGAAEAMSFAEKCTPRAVEQGLRDALFVRVITGVLKNSKLSALTKNQFFDYLTAGISVRDRQDPAGLPPSLAGLVVGHCLRCSNCNRSKNISLSFYTAQKERLGRPFRLADLPRLVCTECRAKGRFEVVE